MDESLLLLGLTLLVAWVGSYSVIRLAPRIGLMHKPNDRSSHSAVVPHGGGLGIVLAGSIAWSWLVSPLTPTPLPEGEGGKLLAVLSLSLLLAVVGLVDDIRHLSAGLRFGVQVVMVAGLVALLGELPGMGLLDGWVLSGLVFFAGLWWVNLFNFMDGIDGIAGGAGGVDVGRSR